MSDVWTLIELTESVKKLRDQVAQCDPEVRAHVVAWVDELFMSLEANLATHERVLGGIGAYAATDRDDEIASTVCICPVGLEGRVTVSACPTHGGAA